MPKNYYTEQEVVLCAYIALYSSGLLSEKKIANFGSRSEGSVKMKIQNIAAMLDEKGIARNPAVKALSGMPPGESGRATDWSILEKLLSVGKENHWTQCKGILIGAAKLK